MTTTPTVQRQQVDVRTHAQRAALIFGAVFIIVGILGFIPGITTNYSSMQFAGHSSDAKLLGIFDVSVLHNLAHLALGIAGLAMARTTRLARIYLIGGGLIYLVLGIWGLVVDRGSDANVIPLNTADNWLHFILAAVMIILGAALSRPRNDLPAQYTRYGG